MGLRGTVTETPAQCRAGVTQLGCCGTHELRERVEHAVRYAARGKQPLLNLVVVEPDLLGAIADAQRGGEPLDQLASLEARAVTEAGKQRGPQAGGAADRARQRLDCGLSAWIGGQMLREGGGRRARKIRIDLRRGGARRCTRP